RGGKMWCGPGQVITRHYRCLFAEKDRADVANTGGDKFLVTRDDLQMLRRQVVDKSTRLIQINDDDNHAELRKRLFNHLNSGKTADLMAQLCGNFCGQPFASCNANC